MLSYVVDKLKYEDLDSLIITAFPKSGKEPISNEAAVSIFVETGTLCNKTRIHYISV